MDRTDTAELARKADERIAAVACAIFIALGLCLFWRAAGAAIDYECGAHCADAFPEYVQEAR